MKKIVFGLIFSIYTYLFVLSIGHSYYLTQINKQLEVVIENLVEQIAEIQSYNAWDDYKRAKENK